MKKIFKIIFGCISFLVICVVIDIVSIYIFNRPIFAIKGSVPHQYIGLLYDTYSCPEFSVAQIKSKDAKFLCSE